MFETDHRLHYIARAEHATALGDNAASRDIAVIHYELALRYSIVSAIGPRTMREDHPASVEPPAFARPSVRCVSILEHQTPELKRA